MTSVRLRRPDDRAAGRTSCAARSSRCCARRASSSTSSWSATAGSRRACPTACAGVGLAEDRGIPAGRNAGAGHARGELLFFLDDDASLAEPDALARVAARFGADPALGLLQLRVDRARRRTRVARLGAAAARRRPARGSEVTAVWEGAVAIPRALFDQVGGWPEEFRFVHEGVDLAWRVMDAGCRVEYRATSRCCTRAGAGARASRLLPLLRHAEQGLARAPAPAAAARASSTRSRSCSAGAVPGCARQGTRGRWRRDFGTGSAQPCGTRRRLSARTLWRMTRAGRPPVI